MAEQQVIIASPTAENNQALGSRIEETVQMSTYQIKKGLEAKRAALMIEYEEFKVLERTFDITTNKISNRLITKMQNYLEEKALPILNLMDEFITIGEDGTFFDDNRTDDIALVELTKAIVNVDKNIRYWNQLSYNDKEVYMHGSINFFGSTEEAYHRFHEEYCVFTPMRTCHSFALEPDEIEHLALVKDNSDSRERTNHEVNEIDLKLKNMESLTEDIRYAMLSEKNSASGDTAVMDIATKISEAFINGTDPSTLLLRK